MTTTSALAPQAATATIDVRTLAPRERHPLIFSTFRGLAIGASLEVVNDHDPLPLYDHFQAERPNGFGWDYLERGPTWRVRISKLDEVAAPHGKGSCCGGCGGGT